MEISRQDAIIDLSKKEGEAFLGKAEATDVMLFDPNHPAGKFNTFREKVEHKASEIAYETERTVEIYMDGVDDRIAYFGDEGLVVEAEVE